MAKDRIDLRGGYFSTKPVTQLKPPPKGPAPGARANGTTSPPKR
jgi:hypothetical protein